MQVALLVGDVAVAMAVARYKWKNIKLQAFSHSFFAALILYSYQVSFHKLYQYFCPVKLHYLPFLAYYNGACLVFGHHMLLLVLCYRAVITDLADTSRKYRRLTSLAVLRRLSYGLSQ